MKSGFMAAMLLATSATAQTPQLTAAQSDPMKLGLMQGSPVPRDKQVRFDDGSQFGFPKLRWAFSNQQALLATATVHRAGAPSPLAVALLPSASERTPPATAWCPTSRAPTRSPLSIRSCRWTRQSRMRSAAKS